MTVYKENKINPASGLYTYKHTKRTRNKIQRLVRVDLDSGTKGILKFPYLELGDKKYKNIVINIDQLKNNMIYGKDKKNNIVIGGIFFVDKDKRVALQLALNSDDLKKAEFVNGNPDKINNNLSIRISALSKSSNKQNNNVIQEEDGSIPSGSNDPGGSNYPGGLIVDEEDQGLIPGKSKWDPILPWKPILPPVPPNIKPQNNFNEVNNINPNHLTPQQILNEIEKNQITGNRVKNNQCGILHPYAYGSKIEGQGPKCCIGKPMAPNKSSGVYQCGNDDGSCGGSCAGNNVKCGYGTCVDNATVTEQEKNMCPVDYPYPMEYYVGTMNSKKWGGRGYFCCKNDPGPNNDCSKENMAVCPQPECRKNTLGIYDAQFVNSIICSQPINNFKQINPGNPLVINNYHTNGVQIDSSKFKRFNTAKFITFSKSPLKDKNGTILSSKYRILSYTNNNNKIKLKLRTSFGILKYNIIVNIDSLYKNYLGKNPKSSPFYITPTQKDMTICKSNDKPLYLVNAQSYGRDFEWEWQQMGSKYISPQFILKNLNETGSFTGDVNSKGGNNTLQDIISRNSPYTIYKSTDSPGSYYYYDKTKIPIDCSTNDSCEETCSGYMNYEKGHTNAKKYYTYCGPKGGMFCVADNNLRGNFRDCKGKSKQYAVPLPYCASTVNTKEYGYSYNKGMDCAAVPYTPTYGILKESSPVSLNNNSSLPCLNPPCCPLEKPDRYVYNVPNSDETIKLCYNSANETKEYSCSPEGNIKGYPSCSNPYFQNYRYIGDNDKVTASKSNINSIIECQNLCNQKANCGMFQYNRNKGTCDLFPLITPHTLKSDYKYTKGYNIGIVYKNDWILDRTFLGGNIFPIKSYNTIHNNVNACLNRCTINPYCNGFSMDKEGNCHLFNTTPVVPIIDNGTISYRVKTDAIGNKWRTRNKLSNNTKMAVEYANNETFINSNNVLNKKEIKDIKKSCPGKNYVNNEACKKTVRQIIKDIKYNYSDRPTCPDMYPHQYDNGKKCCSKPTLMGNKRVGILNKCTGNSIECPYDRCSDNLSDNINYITDVDKVKTVKGYQDSICFFDNNMLKSGYRFNDSNSCTFSHPYPYSAFGRSNSYCCETNDIFSSGIYGPNVLDVCRGNKYVACENPPCTNFYNDNKSCPSNQSCYGQTLDIESIKSTGVEPGCNTKYPKKKINSNGTLTCYNENNDACNCICTGCEFNNNYEMCSTGQGYNPCDNSNNQYNVEVLVNKQGSSPGYCNDNLNINKYNYNSYTNGTLLSKYKGINSVGNCKNLCSNNKACVALNYKHMKKECDLLESADYTEKIPGSITIFNYNRSN